MNNAIRRCLLMLPVMFLVMHNASAHHSFSMFDQKIEKVITGTVVRWAFNNPHSWLYINVTDADGNTTLWSFESSAPPQLIGRGILGNTFEPGDEVTVLYCPIRDGRNAGGLGWSRLADGTFVDSSDGGCDGSAANIARWQELLKQGITSAVKE